MKTLRESLLVPFLAVSLGAQAPVPPPGEGVPTNPASTTSPGAATKRTAEELEQLVAPIALYPDALIALILPAATAPTDIVLAARHVRENPGDRAQIEHRAWDESVKSLTSYPDVLKWMDENLHWTQQIGEAFALQPADVMEAVQRLRAKARAAGTLVDTPQQQVIAESQVIRIVPAQPDIIYVPHYEPEVVFVDRPIYYGRPFLTFGVGVAVGSWLAYDCDWRRRTIWIGNRHRRWTGHDWRHPVVPISPGHGFTRRPEVRQWCPPTHPPRVSFSYTHTTAHRHRSTIVRPTPFGFSSSHSSYQHRTHNPGDYRSTAGSVDPVPRNTVPAPGFAPRSRGEFAGQRPTLNAAADRAPAPTVVTPAAPAPIVQPSWQSRRSGGDWSRGNNGNNGNSNIVRNPESRSHGVRGSSQQAITAPPLPTARASSVPSVSHANPESRGSMPQRSFSRSAAAAPQVAPANVPVPASVIPAPAVVQPAQPVQAAPQSAPASQRHGGNGGNGGGNEGRSNRGGWNGGRHGGNMNAH